MSLEQFVFKPGFYSDDTDRDVGALGYWKDGDHVRFYRGLPQKMGGCVKDNVSAQMNGKVRSAEDWVTTAMVQEVAFGSHKRLYVREGGAFYDITPVASSGTLALDPISTTNTSTTVTIEHTAHGRVVGDGVIFSGAAAVGGITVAGQYEVASVVDADNYTITHSSAASGTATGGGAAVAYQYLVSIGNEDALIETGWGVGSWGTGTWGSPRTGGNTAPARIWALDTWGEDLIACPRGGNVYVWDASAGPGVRATLIAGPAVGNKLAFVSQEDRHLVVCGAGGDPLLIQWSTDEDYTVFTPTATNTAGDKRLDQGNEILARVKVRGEHLIFTDTFLYSMIFTGPPDVFAFRPLGANYGLAGQGAVAEFEGKAYWIGQRGFYLYDGVVREVPCPVRNHVFDDFNSTQRSKTVAGVNSRFGEIWWLYVSGEATEVDRYVIYNAREDVWYFGTISRTVYVGDSDVFFAPYAVSADGYMHWHETGTDEDAEPLTSYIESGDVELRSSDAGSPGEFMMHLSKLLPDFDTLAGSVQLTVTMKKYPQATETQASGPHTITASTQFINPRVRGRQASFRIESSDLGDNWRMTGVIRADVRPHGKR